MTAPALRPGDVQDLPGLLDAASAAGVIVRRRRGRPAVDAPDGTSADLLAALDTARDAVAEELARRGGALGPALAPPSAAPPGPPSAPPSAEGAPLPVTDLQAAYEVGELGYPVLRTPAYVVHGFEVPGLDEGAWSRALRAVLERHEMLRAAVTPDGGQRILPPDPGWAPRVVDLTHLTAGEARAAFEAERDRAGAWLPPLATGPQLASVVFRAGGTAFVLLCQRLFALDARSIGILARDLAAAYRDARPAPRRAGDVTAPTGMFGRYLEGLRAYRGTQAWRNDGAHWVRELRSMPPPPAVPVTARPEEARFARLRHRLAPDRWAAFARQAQARGLSPSTALAAAYADVLRRWSGQDEFTITTLVATRGMVVTRDDDERRALDGCVGNFGTTALLACSPAATFEERARLLQDRLLRDLPHSWVSGVEVARRARAAGAGEAGSPFVFASGLDASAGEQLPPHLTLPGWHLAFKAMQTPTVLLDHQVSIEDGDLVCTFDHVEEAFPEGLVADLVAAHAELLGRLADDGRAWTSSAAAPLPDAALAARRAANATTRPRPAWGVLDALRDGARDTPDRVLLVDAEGETTCAGAEREVRRIGGVLRARGVRPGALVGILVEKSARQYLAGLGVLACGAAYVPLGTDWPPARLRRLVTEHGIGTVLVAGPASAHLLDGTQVDLVDLGDLVGEAAGTPLDRLVSPPHDAVAYVIFTSGSTGVPKGVVISHRGLVGTVDDVLSRFGVTAEDRLLSLSAFHFDLSAFDLHGGVRAGATVLVPPATAHPDPEVWVDWVRRGATVWNSVPALLELTLEHLGDRAAEELKGLRLVLLSGDWVPPALARRLSAACPDATLVALGGATEASIWSNYHVVDAVDPGWVSVPYGRPLANQRFHVLDRQLADVPTWVPGELYIAGDGLAEGYLGRPELTAATFPAHPVTGERLYRTGDHGRYRPDGTLEFLGRRDAQVKVRGYRVDLVEVEQALADRPGVGAAAAVVVGTGAGARLAAFVVGERAAGLDTGALRRGLAEVLPSYAVPGVVLALPAMPLTPNGKRDVARLRELAAAGGAGGPGGAGEAGGADGSGGPLGAAERRMAGLWGRVGVIPAGSAPAGRGGADFFALGGTSVDALRLARLIREETGARVPVSRLFEARTLAQQAALLDDVRDGAPDGALLTLRAGAGGGVPWVLVHPVGGNLLGYADLVAALPEDAAVLGLQAVDPPPGSLDELADRYVTAVRDVPRPFRLVGWSMGGVVATAMAARLDPAALTSVTCIDSYVPSSTHGPVDETVLAAAFAAEHPGVDAAAARDLFAHYRDHYRLLLGHRVTPVAAGVPRVVVTATTRRAGAFPGLVPLVEHPAGLVPATARRLAVPEDHYSVMRAGPARTVISTVVHEETVMQEDRHAGRGRLP